MSGMLVATMGVNQATARQNAINAYTCYVIRAVSFSQLIEFLMELYDTTITKVIMMGDFIANISGPRYSYDQYKRSS